MTPLHKPIHRVTASRLDGSFGPDRQRRIVVTLIPGDGKAIPDLIELRPSGTRRPERLAVADVYRIALRLRVNRELLEKARLKKTAKAIRLARQRQNRAEKRLLKPVDNLFSNK